MCTRKKERTGDIYERVRDRWSAAGAGKTLCVVCTVHMAGCLLSAVLLLASTQQAASYSKSL